MIKQKSGRALFMVMLAMMLVLAACGGNGNNTTNDSSDNKQPANTEDKSTTTSNTSKEEAAKTEETDEPVAFTWMNFYIPGENTMIQTYLEEKYNVKITPIGIDRANAKQQMNLKLASGDKPDLFGNLDAGYPDFVNYVEQGLIGELPIEKIREYAPNYAKMIDDTDPGAWDTGIINGKNYGIPKFYGEGGSPFIPAYNGDWLTAIGYDGPPTTLEELEDVLTKFRNDDPDGNGKKDTYGISARGKDTLGSNQIFNTVLAAHGVHGAGWQVTDEDTVEFGMTSEKARAAFKVLNRWYEAGLIDPEFVTDDWNSYRAKFANGKTGMLDQAMWYHNHVSGQVGADAQSAGLNMVIGKPVIGPEGKMIGLVQGYKQMPFGLGAETVKDENKVAAILRLLDGVAMNLEDYMMVSYGVEGEHYDVVDGGPQRKEAFIDPINAAASVGMYFFALGNQNPGMIQHDIPSEKQAFKDMVNDPAITPMPDAMQLRILPSFEANRDALTKMVSEYKLKFVVGEVDLDEGFDKFVAEMNSLGLEQAAVEANEIYANAKN